MMRNEQPVACDAPGCTARTTWGEMGAAGWVRVYRGAQREASDYCTEHCGEAEDDAAAEAEKRSKLE